MKLNEEVATDFFRAVLCAGDPIRRSELNAPIIFAHVPKTAGTSLSQELAGVFDDYFNIEVDYRDQRESFHSQLDKAVADFLPLCNGVRFASGHIMSRHVLMIRRACPAAEFITFLRDPVARVLSDFNHQRSPRHPRYLEFQARVPDIETYLSLSGERNKTARHLLPESIFIAADPEECIEYIIKTYAFVGLCESYEESFVALTNWLGHLRRPTVRANVGLDGGGSREVDPTLRDRIRRFNSLDCAIYDGLSPLLRSWFENWRVDAKGLVPGGGVEGAEPGARSEAPGRAERSAPCGHHGDPR